jgi:hypothetical protein
MEMVRMIKRMTIRKIKIKTRTKIKKIRRIRTRTRKMRRVKMKINLRTKVIKKNKMAIRMKIKMESLRMIKKINKEKVIRKNRKSHNLNQGNYRLNKLKTC